ncbi:biotin--[acetyl-CoA-carboxylase] ligase [Acuticoccus yangtzensis]|uniref:biotin--[acetyl-CoA-carboxylase] ligase n=1 Tax=Acuticoccus yangtzensis TaxID=1443441 RepID=UPI0009FA40F1|nr:biotin--[acetyl-CoA-carboxylase] ligase [Acuticoccus yangtzensis]
MDADPVGGDGRGAELLLTPGRADPASATLILAGDVGSTNDDAMAHLRATGASVWVAAERQLAGRGRRGRPWVSERGNLYASFAFAPTWSNEAFGILPLAAAVALADAIAKLGITATLKWPNDVLVTGLKVSGILIESEWAGTERRVVVGYGVNVAHHPETMPATHLKAHRPDLSVDIVRSALIGEAAATFNALGHGDGVATIRARWLDRAAGIGGPIDVRLDDETRSGVFEGLDETGRLMLRRPDNRLERISAGDVFLKAAL